MVQLDDHIGESNEPLAGAHAQSRVGEDIFDIVQDSALSLGLAWRRFDGWIDLVGADLLLRGLGEGVLPFLFDVSVLFAHLLVEVREGFVVVGVFDENDAGIG
jgi:hypothetical protein